MWSTCRRNTHTPKIKTNGLFWKREAFVGSPKCHCKGPWSWYRAHPDTKFPAQRRVITPEGGGGAAFGSDKGSCRCSAEADFMEKKGEVCAGIS